MIRISQHNTSTESFLLIERKVDVTDEMWVEVSRIKLERDEQIIAIYDAFKVCAADDGFSCAVFTS